MRVFCGHQWPSWPDRNLGEGLYTRLREKISMSRRNEYIEWRCGICQLTLVATAKDMKAHAKKCARKKTK